MSEDYNIFVFVPHGATAPSGPGPPHYRGFTITLRHTTVGRTPLHEGSARRRDLYLTTHNSHKRQTSMPPVGFEPAIPASARPQDPRIDLAATGIGIFVYYCSPSLFYLLTVGVEFVYFHLITLRHTPQSVGLLWTRDHSVAETST
jgi:hypothetical protein